MERHSDRENVIALYLKEHLGAAEVKILVDHPSREIVYLSVLIIRPEGIGPIFGAELTRGSGCLPPLVTMMKATDSGTSNNLCLW